MSGAAGCSWGRRLWGDPGAAGTSGVPGGGEEPPASRPAGCARGTPRVYHGELKSKCQEKEVQIVFRKIEKCVLRE